VAAGVRNSDRQSRVILAVALYANGEHSAAVRRFDEVVAKEVGYLERDPWVAEWATRSRNAMLRVPASRTCAASPGAFSDAVTPAPTSWRSQSDWTAFRKASDSLHTGSNRWPN
jgi:hypothetical protein